MMKQIFFALFAGLVCTIPVHAQTDAAPAPAFEVAGLSIGMSPSEARAAMKEKGFTETESSFHPSYGPTFEERVTQARTGKPGGRSGLKGMQFKKGDQTINLRFEPFKAGNKLDLVRYSSPSLNNDCDAFLNTLTERYGAPHTKFNTSRKWRDKDFVNGNSAPGTLTLDAKCLGGKLTLARFGSRMEIAEAIKKEVGAVERDF